MNRTYFISYVSNSRFRIYDSCDNEVVRVGIGERKYGIVRSLVLEFRDCVSTIQFKYPASFFKSLISDPLIGLVIRSDSSNEIYLDVEENYETNEIRIKYANIIYRSFFSPELLPNGSERGAVFRLFKDEYELGYFGTLEKFYSRAIDVRKPIASLCFGDEVSHDGTNDFLISFAIIAYSEYCVWFYYPLTLTPS